MALTNRGVWRNIGSQQVAVSTWNGATRACYSKESQKRNWPGNGYAKLSGSAGVGLALGRGEGNVTKLKGTVIKKLSGPAGVGMAGPG